MSSDIALGTVKTPMIQKIDTRTLQWEQTDNGLQMTTLHFDHHGVRNVQAYTLTFTADLTSATTHKTGGKREVHIYKILLLREMQFQGDTSNPSMAAIATTALGSVCPPMQFTGTTENQTIERMNAEMGHTLESTQCETLFQNLFKTYAGTSYKHCL
jgi:hypothetical protein